MSPDIFNTMAPVAAIVGVTAVVGWGQAVYPKNDQEAVERVRLLSQENAQLRAELGSIKDRLANVEKIVVDDSHRLTSEIEALRGPTN